MSKRLAFPPKGRLSPTGPVDVIDDYYRFPIGWLLRRRLQWLREALGDQRYGTILEIGYGSGIFQYELARHSDRLAGIDIHSHASSVAATLAQDGITSHLIIGDAGHLPLADGSVDAVVMVSVLEFVPNPLLSLDEAKRVLRPQGRLVLLRPRELRWADALWRLMSRRDPGTEFGAARSNVASALGSLEGCRRVVRPKLLVPGLSPYEVVVWERS